MNFREYYTLHEDLNFVLMKNRAGHYQVLGPKPTAELPRVVQSAKDANNPVGIWTYNTTGGHLDLPPELEKDREAILHAHFAHQGLDVPSRLPERPEDEQDDSDYIDPKVFNKDYEQQHAQWKKYQGQQHYQQPQPQDPATASFKAIGGQSWHGTPMAGGMPTPPPKAVRRS